MWHVSGRDQEVGKLLKMTSDGSILKTTRKGEFLGRKFTLYLI